MNKCEYMFMSDGSMMFDFFFMHGLFSRPDITCFIDAPKKYDPQNLSQLDPNLSQNLYLMVTEN